MLRNIQKPQHQGMLCHVTDDTHTADKVRSQYPFASTSLHLLASTYASSYLLYEVTDVNSVLLTFISDLVDILGQVRPARYSYSKYKIF